METSSFNFMNGMCRCCASEGVFKDFRKPYTWMGEEEVYADMLKECFDLNLHTSEVGQEGGICEVCITQLRNASNFKKQVLNTEEQFKKHIQNKLFKPSIVKVEVADEAEDSDENNMSADDSYSGTEYEIPVKAELDEPKTKKRAAAVKATTKTSRAKKSKADVGESSTKSVGCNSEINIMPKLRKLLALTKQPISDANKDNDWTITLTKSRSNQQKVHHRSIVVETNLKEITKHLQNARTILLHSNATPIRSYNGIGYTCCFCSELFPLPKDLKTHTLEKHDKTEKQEFMRNCSLAGYIVKLDITQLKCDICGEDIENLKTLIHHLQVDHSKIFHTDIKDHILPFKFEDDVFSCVICSTNFERFKLVQEHMNLHYRNHTCQLCASSFVNEKTLKNHASRHKKGDFTCSFCPKVFDNQVKRYNHESFAHKGNSKRNMCPYCKERFLGYAEKYEHMVQEHGVKPLLLTCNACDKTFKRRDQLTRHIKRDHLLERKYECDYCEKKFYAKKGLNGHMLKHTGVKKYICEVCLKSFGRKSTLTEHMRIHKDDRRFKCENCGQTFVQKCSLKSHMRTKHGKNL